MAELSILFTTAITIGVIHTIIGVDHYVPFIALSQANKWTIRKTMLIVLLCGIGHVLSSVTLGFIGIGLSTALLPLVDIESIRGEIATYFLIVFGLVYTIYGLRRAMKNKTHSHTDHHGHTVMHTHGKNGEIHEHAEQKAKKTNNTFWGLFILFVLGPCEPLIPILMYPAATHNTLALISVTASFAVCTISTMLLLTFLGIKSVRLIKVGKLERYSHALAGSAILLCGISVLALPI